jgi:pectate lyase
MITEACAKFKNGENTGHRFGGIWGNNYSTYHHNLFAHNDSRNPRWASGTKYNDYRNNVLYNWGYNSCYGGEALEDSDPDLNFFTVNMIANYYKPGPATRENVQRRIAAPGGNPGVGSWYVTDNYVEGFPNVTADNWLGIDGTKYIKLNAPWDAMLINQESPQDAYLAVLAHAGCSKPNRDTIDQRIIEEVRNGTATYGNNGIITTPSDVGGWPTLTTEPAPEDSDGDGMPDEWESRYGLDSNDAADGPRDTDGDVYTNVEEYLNETDPTEFVDYTKAENLLNERL